MSSDGAPHMYGLDEEIFGKSWQKWTTRWWKWYFSIPKESHPAFDTSGERWNISQNDPNVCFLAGTSGGLSERNITIPAGKAVLFPVINFATSYAEDPSLKTEEEITSVVKSNIDDIRKKEANIDGVDLAISDDNRVQSPPFDFTFPIDNIYGVKNGPTRGAGDGYWIFLKPLSPGRHTIRTFGSCLSGRIQIGVNINITVK